MKKSKKFKAKYDIYIALIEEDLPDVGWQIYIYENGKDIYDNVQDTLKICKEEAFEDWGIPLDSWEEVFE